MKILGKFDSVSLAVRELKHIESIKRTLVPLTAYYCADFDDDEAGFSHFKYVAGPMTYFIGKGTPKPRKDAS